MSTIARLIGSILILNAVRYVVAGPIEQLTVLPPLFAAMADSPTIFNTDFSSSDWITSFAYNALMWAAAVLTFHGMHPQPAGGWAVKSLKSYGLMCVFFLSVSAIYMNHYSHPQVFSLYNMGSAVIAFTVVAPANALLYPRIVCRKQKMETGASVA